MYIVCSVMVINQCRPSFGSCKSLFFFIKGPNPPPPPSPHNRFFKALTHLHHCTHTVTSIVTRTEFNFKDGELQEDLTQI